MYMKNVVVLPSCIILPLHAKVVTKVGMQPQHHRILPFVDVMTKKCIELVSDKDEEEGMEDAWGRLQSFYTWLCVECTHYFVDIEMSNFMLYFHLCPKTIVNNFFAMSPSIHFSKLYEF